MVQEQASDEALQQYHESVAATVLRGYCRDLPMDVVSKIIEINQRYGSWAAMEAAIAVMMFARMSPEMKEARVR